MRFKITHNDIQTKARTGILSTDHGNIETPAFMPVGTAGTVKGIHHRELINDIHAQIILGNTYHLYLRPGIQILQEAGGLHRFMNWPLPLLTDSGGYQVFSLADHRKLSDEGAIFKSHIDGSTHKFTPESIVDIQRIIGADIIMAFDECAPYPCDHKYALKAMTLTHHWLDRGIKQYKNSAPLYGYDQIFFPIVQGSTYKDLRIQSAEKIASCNLEGNAIGGLSVGEHAEIMYEMIETVNRILPVDKPRYLMGVGTPINILEAISIGIDMFDCVMPTRNGRNGMLYTSKGVINIKNEKWKNNYNPIDPDSDCYIDTQYSLSYLRHLFVCKEILGSQIASIHNLYFYLWLVKEARKNIVEGSFEKWKTVMIKQLNNRL